jgi:predicted hydrocarbon binding protein
MAGGGSIANADLETKAEWTKGAMDRLDGQIPNVETRMEIMSRCSCRCADEQIARFRKAYKGLKNVGELLKLMHPVPFYHEPIMEGDTIYITKRPRHMEEFLTAKTMKEKLLYYCHCDYIRAVSGEVSPTFCYCGAGWAKRIWEHVLEQPVKVQVVKSVLQGDDFCRLAVQI